MTKYLSTALAATLSFGLASPLLADRVGEVRAELYQAMVENHAAREIAKQCKTISIRQGAIVKGAKQTRDDLLARGYTQKELRKAALSAPTKAAKKAGKEWPVALGATPGDRASYCTVGVAEAAKNSTIGSYLKPK